MHITIEGRAECLDVPSFISGVQEDRMLPLQCYFNESNYSFRSSHIRPHAHSCFEREHDQVTRKLLVPQDTHAANSTGS